MKITITACLFEKYLLLCVCADYTGLRLLTEEEAAACWCWGGSVLLVFLGSFSSLRMRATWVAFLLDYLFFLSFFTSKIPLCDWNGGGLESED
jgi:hypothetical protein